MLQQVSKHFNIVLHMFRILKNRQMYIFAYFFVTLSIKSIVIIQYRDDLDMILSKFPKLPEFIFQVLSCFKPFYMPWVV